MPSINEMQRNQFLVIGIAVSFVLGATGTSATILLQPAFAHALNIKNIEVESAGNRGVTIVLGHASESAYGAKPGIHDGMHGVEVLLEDRDTALPITGAQLKVDKYYFRDINAFNKAHSVNDATEIQSNVTLGSVFGEPGHYIARQVQKDGIYGYRLYGNISYFSVANLPVNSTVFCKSAQGNTTKFNSPGWFGGFGCTEDIDDILFPQRNNDVNAGISNRTSFEMNADHGQVPEASPDSSGTAQTTASNVVTSPAMTANGAGLQQAASPAIELQLLMFGLPATGIASIIGIRVIRNPRRDQNL